MERNSRLPALTGLRGAAALGVFGQNVLDRFFNQHLDAPHEVRSLVWAVLVNSGSLGVSFFFVLSGFVLTWSARPGEGAGTFWWRRFTKIYPATLVTTLAAVVVIGGAGPVQLVTQLTLTHTWLPRERLYGALNPVSWSLAAEAFFYLCFPLLLAALRRCRPVALWALSGMMVEFVVLVAVDLIPLDHATALWVGYLFPPVRMAEFTLGITLALLVRSGAWRGPGLRWSLALVLPAAVASLFVPFPLSQHALTLVPLALVVAAAARADLQGVRTLWSHPLTVYLGKLSFAFYLVHYLVLVGFERVGLLPQRTGPQLATLATLSVFAFSMLAAMIVYHGVERPCLRLLRGGRSDRSDWAGAHGRAAPHVRAGHARSARSGRHRAAGIPVQRVPAHAARARAERSGRATRSGVPQPIWPSMR